MSRDCISCDRVSLRLKQHQILKQVSFSQKMGESLAVIGHNGAGKTTLFHVLLGFKFRDSGEFRVLGVDVASPRAREFVGFVPERPYLALDTTLRKTLRYLGNLSGLSGRSLEDRILEVSRRVALDSVLDRPMKTFSKGMLQKGLIAQAELHRPQLLVLDEPMSGLDPEARQFLKEQIKSWKQENRTILFSSHSMEDVQELADRVLVMESGELTFHGNVSEWGARGIRAHALEVKTP